MSRRLFSEISSTDPVLTAYQEGDDLGQGRDVAFTTALDAYLKQHGLDHASPEIREQVLGIVISGLIAQIHGLWMRVEHLEHENERHKQLFDDKAREASGLSAKAVIDDIKKKTAMKAPGDHDPGTDEV
jgi:hypothetical protein